MEREKEGRRGGARTAKDRGKAGSIGMMGRRQVIPRWVDYPVQRHYRHQWRGCGVRMGLPPPQKNIVWIKDRAGRVKNKYVTISDGA